MFELTGKNNIKKKKFLFQTNVAFNDNLEDDLFFVMSSVFS